MAEIFKAQAQAMIILLTDSDNKYTREFESILSEVDIEIKQVGPRAPNLNAFAERWVGSIKSECLDHFCCFGEDHLQYIISEYVDHYEWVS